MKKLALISVVGLALSGCGGSGSDNNDSSSTLPTAKPSAAIGSVESVDAKESTLTVNGYTYRVSKVVYGTTPLALAVVQPNMMVKVDENIQKTADAHAVVSLEPTITGRVTAIDYAKKTFTVNGVELQFDGLSNEIGLGDWVMVSSLPTADAGYKVLSVVEIDVDHYPSIGDMYEIEGRIASIDANQSTFKLGANITVSYHSVDQLKVGQWVEAEGKMEGVLLSPPTSK